MKCPSCAHDFVRAVARSGIIEWLLRLARVHPFKCQLCGHRFRSYEPGFRYFGVDEDRRAYDRLERQFPTKFSGRDMTGEGMVLDVAMGGCTFSTRSELAVDMVLKMDLRIAAAVAPVVVEAAVVRNVRAGIAGVEFVRWQESDRERLQLFVAGMLIGRVSSRARDRHVRLAKAMVRVVDTAAITRCRKARARSSLA